MTPSRGEVLAIPRLHPIHIHDVPGRFVWHCHIVEHGDNEIMRPFDVLPAS